MIRQKRGGGGGGADWVRKGKGKGEADMVLAVGWSGIVCRGGSEDEEWRAKGGRRIQPCSVHLMGDTRSRLVLFIGMVIPFLSGWVGGVERRMLGEIFGKIFLDTEDGRGWEEGELKAVDMGALVYQVDIFYRR